MSSQPTPVTVPLEPATPPLPGGPFPAVFRRDVGRRCIYLFLGILLIGVVVTFGLWTARHQLFAAAGGDLATLKADGVPEPPKDASKASFWAFKLLYEGILTYSIIAAVIAVLGYGIGVILIRVVPGFFGVERDLARLRHLLEAPQLDGYKTLVSLGEKAGIRPRGRLMARFELLDRTLRQPGASRESLQSANDRFTALEEAVTSYALQPLIYLEWLLPILGFLGTVWGVTEAVEGLRTGIQSLFKMQGLTDEVLRNFMDGFKGLVLAFDTTLFGLIGLGVAGSFNFFLRKSALYVLVNLDKWSSQAIGLLKFDDELLARFERLVREGFFLTDSDGKPVEDDDGKPTLRLERFLQEGFFETNNDGKLQRDQDGKPTPRLARPIRELGDLVRLGFFHTDDQGRIVNGPDGRPILRLQESVEMLLRGLFVTDGKGNVILDPALGGAPVERAAAARARIHHLLVNYVFEVAPGVVLDPNGTGPIGQTEDGRQVPLRSRHERRHEETKTFLLYLAYLLRHGSHFDPPEKDESTAVAVLDATGQPVDAIALTNRRFAVARTAVPPGDTMSENQLVPGDFVALDGGYRRAVPSGQPFLETDRISALCGWNEFLARAQSDSGGLEVGDWGQGFPEQASWSGPGKLVPGALAIFARQGVPHVLGIAEDDNTSEIALVQWEGSGTAPVPSVYAKLPGTLQAFACRPGEAVALVVAGDDGYRLLLVRPDSAPLERKIGADILALAFAPDGSLWWVNADGNAGQFDPSTGTFHERLGFAPVSRFGLSAAGELIGLAKDGRLVARDRAGNSTARTLTTATPVTALALSPDGESILTGHADGSVCFYDGRRPVR